MQQYKLFNHTKLFFLFLNRVKANWKSVTMTSTFNHDASANYSVNNPNHSGQDENKVQLLSYTPNSNKSPITKRNGTAYSGMENNIE